MWWDSFTKEISQQFFSSISKWKKVQLFFDGNPFFPFHFPVVFSYSAMSGSPWTVGVHGHIMKLLECAEYRAVVCTVAWRHMIARALGAK